MIVLALDTAGVDCAVAVYDGDRDSVLGEVTETIGWGHAEHLMSIVDRTLDKAGIALGDIGRVAVTIGPGSFTGIRVGVAAARGFALSLGVPAVGVTTLAVLAAAARNSDPGRAVLAAMDAKRNEIYLQAFERNGDPVGAPRLVDIADARVIADRFDGLVVGSAASLLKSGTPTGETDVFPISVVARLGAAMPPGDKPKPLYLRGPDARPQTGYAVARV